MPAPGREDPVHEDAALARDAHPVGVRVHIRDRPVHELPYPGEVVARRAETWPPRCSADWYEGSSVSAVACRSTELLPHVAEPSELNLVELHAAPDGVALDTASPARGRLSTASDRCAWREDDSAAHTAAGQRVTCVAPSILETSRTVPSASSRITNWPRASSSGPSWSLSGLAPCIMNSSAGRNGKVVGRVRDKLCRRTRGRAATTPNPYAFRPKTSLNSRVTGCHEPKRVDPSRRSLRPPLPRSQAKPRSKRRARKRVRTTRSGRLTHRGRNQPASAPGSGRRRCVPAFRAHLRHAITRSAGR